MKTPSRALRPGRLLLLGLALLGPARAEAPAWWTTRGVLVPGAAPDDHAALNQGQARHLARQAYEEMRLRLAPLGRPGPALDALWADPAPSQDDYRVVNLGQLKALAKPFYDRLIALRCLSAYPWSSSIHPPDDHALANLGQAKNLFALDFEAAALLADSDQNGLPDLWELRHFGRTGIDPEADPNGNGVPNRLEHLEGTDPTLNFYQGVAPRLAIVEGNHQAPIPGEFLLRPWKVRVLRPDGTPWAGAPVRFTATADEGLLARERAETAPLASALTVIADAQGYAQVWLKCP